MSKNRGAIIIRELTLHITSKSSVGGVDRQEA